MTSGGKRGMTVGKEETLSAPMLGADDPRTRVRAFCESLRALNDRAALMSVADGSPSGDPASVQDTLDLLRMQREELMVADEELHEQAEEIARTARLLRDERTRSRCLFDLSPDARFVTDEFGLMLDANLAMAELLGIEVRFLLRKPMAAYLDRADVARFRQAITEVVRSGSAALDLTVVGRRSESAAVTLEGSRAEGERRLIWCALVARSHSGIVAAPRLASPPAVVAPVAPESERLLADAERRCAELTSRQLARDLSMAVVAHELRGPTSAILGWARLLRHPRVDAGPRERALAVIEENALLQLALVDDLMDASRITAHRLEIERVALDLREVVASVLDGAQPRAAERQITLASELADGCEVQGDGRRLMQATANLLNNALKFTPPGGSVVVRLTTDDGVATLEVVDSGVGIAAVQLPHIFDRFHQGGRALDAAGGLGLGLFLVREIVELHGGTVTGTSPGEGLGSTFSITLPRLRPEAPASPVLSPQ